MRTCLQIENIVFYTISHSFDLFYYQRCCQWSTFTRYIFLFLLRTYTYTFLHLTLCFIIMLYIMIILHIIIMYYSHTLCYKYTTYYNYVVYYDYIIWLIPWFGMIWYGMILSMGTSYHLSISIYINNSVVNNLGLCPDLVISIKTYLLCCDYLIYSMKV